jgi:lipopolysaccharide export system protein LptC
MDAGFDHGYSRFVAWLKIVLPLTALAVLSSLFLLSRNVDPRDASPFVALDVQNLAREQRISAPHFASVTDDGTAVLVTATTARAVPGTVNVVDASDIRARLERTDGAVTNLASRSGTIDSDDSTAILRGGVIITTSTGYRIITDVMHTRLDRTELESEGEVTADGPAGRLTAGKMQLSQTGDAADSNLLVFKNGVNLIYTPSD